MLELQQFTKQHLSINSYDQHKMPSLLKAYLVKETYPSYLITKAIIQKHLENNKELSYEMRAEMYRGSKSITNLLTLLYLYQLYINRVYQSTNRTYFNEILIDIKKIDTPYHKTINWLNQLEDDLQYTESCQIIMEFFPAFCKNQLHTIKEEELEFLVKMLNLYQLNSQRKVQTYLQYLIALKNVSIYSHGKFQDKQLIIIRVICESILDVENSGSKIEQKKINPRKKGLSGNIGMLFDEFILGSDKKYVQRFCNIHSNYFINLAEDQLIKLFLELTKASSNITILYFIYFIIRILQNQEEFYKLKLFYQIIILPIIARRWKACVREKIAEMVLKISQRFIIGFCGHCDIGKEGLLCILENIQQIQAHNMSIKNRWIELALLLTEIYPMNRNFVLDHLKQHKIEVSKPILSMKREDLIGKEYIWEITVRDSRKRKNYKQKKSQFRGIVNKSSQCYIISNVQALFMTKKLSSLVQRVKPTRKPRVVDELMNLFKRLSNKPKQYEEKITINDLKDAGPAVFSESDTQEDAQQYLISLFEQIQQQLKQQNKMLFEEFKKIFEIKCLVTIKCLNNGCQNIIRTEQTEYVHTIPNRSILRCEVTEKLNDFKCDKCGREETECKRQLKPQGELFILHINRFSHEKGRARKQLSTQTIPRQFISYQLVGIIFHIGKNVESGHYLYYSKIGPKKWAEMNDNYVGQFELDDQKERFQEEMKAEKTPYLLFYRKKAV